MIARKMSMNLERTKKIVAIGEGIYMPKFIQIIGPQAVGKITVGQELAKITGYKLLYNHMTIEMARFIFDYDKEAFREG